MRRGVTVLAGAIGAGDQTSVRICCASSARPLIRSRRVYQRASGCLAL